MHTQPWVVVASLFGMEEETAKRATMALWLDYSGMIAYAEQGASGQGPGAIKRTSETF